MNSDITIFNFVIHARVLINKYSILFNNFNQQSSEVRSASFYIGINLVEVKKIEHFPLKNYDLLISDINHHDNV